jgi:HEAT repeat protein
VSFLFPSSTITFDAALRDLAQGSPKARTAAAHALGDVSDPTEKRRAIDALMRALDDDRPEVRAEACASLGAISDPTDAATRAALVHRLDDGSPQVRQNAAIALGTLAHPEDFEALAHALREGPADLRFQAATSLAEIDAARAYEPMLAALDDADPQVVAAAALSLGAIGDARAIAPLAARLDHREPATRFDVAYALAELGDPQGRDVLGAALGDRDRAWDAVSALTRLATDADAKLLGRALVSKTTPPEAVVLAAGAILTIAPGGRYHDAARRALLAALGARKVHVRGIAVEQLGEIGGSWATGPLEKLARSSKGTDLLDPIATALRAIEDRATGIARRARPAQEDGA